MCIGLHLLVTKEQSYIKNSTKIPNQVLRKMELNITFSCSFLTKVCDAAEKFLLHNDHKASWKNLWISFKLNRKSVCFIDQTLKRFSCVCLFLFLKEGDIWSLTKTATSTCWIESVQKCSMWRPDGIIVLKSFLNKDIFRFIEN